MLYGDAPKSAVVIVGVVMSSLSTILTSTRLYARFAISKNAGRDDAFIFAAMLFSWATTGFMIVQTQTGLGDHMESLTRVQLKENLRAYWSMIIVYNMSLFCTKFSILFQYLRIFPQRTFRNITHGLMAIVLAYAIWRLFSAIFTCTPPASFWDHSIKHKTCQNRLALSLASTTLNMVTDILITALPLPLLQKLQLPARQRWGLVAVFALAGLVVVVSILRLPALYHLMSSKDITWENPWACIWSQIEINVGIMCSCLPTLRCLFPKIFSAATGYSTGSSGKRSSYSHCLERPVSPGWAPFDKEAKSKGRFSCHVSSPSATYKTHRLKPSWASRHDTVLDRSDDIELVDQEGEISDLRQIHEGHIMVQTEIDQEIALRSEEHAHVRQAKSVF